MTPTLLDVVMITGLDSSSPCPSAFRLSEVPFKLSSKIECTNWGAYLNQHIKTKGPVTKKEHTAFLNLWLEHFLFCGPSLAPTKNYLPLAYELVKGSTVGLGKLFLGKVYRYLHLMSLSLLTQKKLRTGGPRWFIQLWAHLYFQDFIPNFPVLANNSFPDQGGRRIRCTSFGQALYSLPGSKLNPSSASNWFRIFYRGLDNPIFLPYTDSEIFENPITFRLANFTDDDSTRHLYSIMIHPCFLPVGMSNSNRIIKPGYEFYQLVIAAWQFGLGQVPPHFFLHHLTTIRADLSDILTSQRCYGLFSDLLLPIPVDLTFTSSAIGFESWWSMWKTHVFRKALGPMLQQIHAEYEASEEEEDGPEPKNDDGSTFRFLPVAPVVLFSKNAPPPSKTKARKKTVRKIRKEAGPSSTGQEAPIVNQADTVDISSGEELVHQEDPTPEALEDPLTTVNALVNLQDPILKTPENLATPADTLVGL
ncbi:uncharacterized protein LOC112900357 isoform X2 [Panicum hallii]|uniref:uncharacterized protein LOC112900357 isoform X2 n=1 Tax=Panicum hallii TaxID=206008 RepID=UPI000DF4F10F|nr:uncharacterized protein LOC112900357 isoform X2 [Panicum hallii]